MKVILASAEVDPFAKVGGLADVAGSLPKALAEDGIEIAVVMPKYRVAAAKAGATERVLDSVPVAMPTYMSGCAVEMTHLPGSEVPVYMIEHDNYFDREGIYGPAGGAYADNAQRLSFFCRATLATIEALDFDADVIHLNDWHTSLIAAYCKLWDLPYATVFTGHNLGGAYQGTFPQSVLGDVGLDLADRRVREATPDGQLNLARVGLIFSDMLNTVSEKYAKELIDPAVGGTLSELIASRGEDMWGIVNGIDYDTWTPSGDGEIAAAYDADDRAGKGVCKAALQEAFSLPVDPDVPVIGMVDSSGRPEGPGPRGRDCRRHERLPAQRCWGPGIHIWRRHSRLRRSGMRMLRCGWSSRTRLPVRSTRGLICS